MHTSNLSKGTPAKHKNTAKPRQDIFLDPDCNTAAQLLHLFTTAMGGTQPARAFATTGFKYREKCPIPADGNCCPVPAPRPGKPPGHSRPILRHHHNEKEKKTSTEGQASEEEEAHSPEQQSLRAAEPDPSTLLLLDLSSPLQEGKKDTKERSGRSTWRTGTPLLHHPPGGALERGLRSVHLSSSGGFYSDHHGRNRKYQETEGKTKI